MHLLKLNRVWISLTDREEINTETCLLRLFFFTIWQLDKIIVSYVTLLFACKDIVLHHLTEYIQFFFYERTSLSLYLTITCTLTSFCTQWYLLISTE